MWIVRKKEQAEATTSTEALTSYHVQHASRIARRPLAGEK